MLVLTRKVGEEVVLQLNGQVIRVVVVALRDHNGVRLGFDARPEVRIDRKEVFDERNRPMPRCGYRNHHINCDCKGEGGDR